MEEEQTVRVLLLITLLLSSSFAYFKILQELNLNDIDVPNFSEISDLAYNPKEHKLYMISDKGRLFIFRAYFDNKVHLKYLSQTPLKNKKGKKLKGKKRDSEGLVFAKNSLYASFERKLRVAKLLEDGRVVKKIKLPKALKKAKPRGSNKMLEALAYHPKYGFLTALEYAQKGRKKCSQQIFSTSGKTWNIELEKFKNCAITALEVMDKESILILERAYGGVFREFAVTLIKFNLKTKQKEILYQISTSKDDRVENYEGLSKVGKNRYLMISDDNDNPFANTKLIYFEAY